MFLEFFYVLRVRNHIVITLYKVEQQLNYIVEYECSISKIK